jgi:hypothetical protein
VPPIASQQAWEQLLEETWANAENLARLIEQLPDQQVWEIFTDEKYGNYYRNFHGLIEHNYYHLGQIVLIRKILMDNEKE